MDRKHTGKKFVAIILLLGAAFGAGFYVGRQPPEEVKKQIKDLSQEVVEQTQEVVEHTIGLGEGELLAQKKFLQAKSEFLDGKAKILDGKPDEAVAELEKTLDYLKEAVKLEREETSDALFETMSEIGDLRRSLADGQAVSREALEDAQAKLEALLL